MFVFCIKRLSKGGHQTANPPSMPSLGERPPRGQTLLPGMLMRSAPHGRMGLGWGSPPCPEQAGLGVHPELVPIAGHGEQLRGCSWPR